MSGSPDSHFQFFNDPVRGAALERLDLERLPRHVAVIMDGNGRWAQSRGLPRTAGHKAGIAAVREAILACDELGIGSPSMPSRPRIGTGPAARSTCS